MHAWLAPRLTFVRIVTSPRPSSEAAQRAPRSPRRVCDTLRALTVRKPFFFQCHVQGINPKINYKIILKECKKKFNCNGTIVDDPDLGQIIQLQGDQRKLVAQFLVDEKISKKELIKIHGS